VFSSFLPFLSPVWPCFLMSCPCFPLCFDSAPLWFNFLSLCSAPVLFPYHLPLFLLWPCVSSITFCSSSIPSGFASCCPIHNTLTATSIRKETFLWRIICGQ
jgi:hypothetical protein